MHLVAPHVTGLSKSRCLKGRRGNAEISRKQQGAATHDIIRRGNASLEYDCSLRGRLEPAIGTGLPQILGAPPNHNGQDTLAMGCCPMGLPQLAKKTHAHRNRTRIPSFSTADGTYAGSVTVGITCAVGLKLRYIAHRVDGDGNGCPPCSHSKMFLEGLVYRKPLVFDQCGSYIVHAMSICDEHSLKPSAVVTARYTIRQNQIENFSPQRICTLPLYVLHGTVQVEATVGASHIQSMQRLVARAAGKLESTVVIRLMNSDVRSAEVQFSLNLGQDDDADTLLGNMIGRSLVVRIASAVGVSAGQVALRADVRPLQDVLLYLNWVAPKRCGSSDYLDGSCLIYSQDRLLDVVDYHGSQNMNSNNVSQSTMEWSAGKGESATVVHSGDLLCKRGGKHAIRVCLRELPDYVTDCFFVISAYTSRNLSKFRSLSMSLHDAETKIHVLANSMVASMGLASAAVVCSLTREGTDWTLYAYGQPCGGTVRDYGPIEAAIAPIQRKHAYWYQRAPFVHLEARRKPQGLKMPRECNAAPVLKLPLHVARHVISFL